MDSSTTARKPPYLRRRWWFVFIPVAIVLLLAAAVARTLANSRRNTWSPAYLQRSATDQSVSRDITGEQDGQEEELHGGPLAAAVDETAGDSAVDRHARERTLSV